MPAFFTRNGDDGSTGLLGDERVPKYHLRPTTYGTLDEASAALGLVRALSLSVETHELILEVQRDLYKIMAEVAATPEEAPRFRSIDADRISWLEAQIEAKGEQVEMPKGFVLPGDSKGGAALDLARTIIRRGERLLAQLDHEDGLDNPHLLPYLNRLSSFCFILALWENAQAGNSSISLANPEIP